MPSATFYHHVYFWLNNPDDPAEREEFLTSLKAMRDIPTVLHSHIGTPNAEPRPVVENSYTFYWLTTFADKDAWRVYDSHPLHDAFRAKSRLWNKILVMDTQQVD